MLLVRCQGIYKLLTLACCHHSMHCCCCRQVCRAGQTLDPNQAALLRVFGVKMATFRLTPLAWWSRDGEQCNIYTEPVITITISPKHYQSAKLTGILAGDGEQQQQDPAAAAAAAEPDIAGSRLRLVQTMAWWSSDGEQQQAAAAEPDAAGGRCLFCLKAGLLGYSSGRVAGTATALACVTALLRRFQITLLLQLAV
jgi:hypothetical protein